MSELTQTRREDAAPGAPGAPGTTAEVPNLEQSLVDFEQMRSDTAGHIYRQAEARLSAQAQLYTASVTRAVTFSGIAVALGSIFLGLSLSEANTIGSGHGVTDIQLAMLVSFMVCALSFLVGAALAIRACEAVEFNIPGNKPRTLIFNKDYLKLKNAPVWDAYHLESSIEENHEILTKKARLLSFAQKITFVTPLVGFVLFFIVVWIK
jgi:hypothetical protein